jgi:hypothetical protein
LTKVKELNKIKEVDEGDVTGVENPLIPKVVGADVKFPLICIE